MADPLSVGASIVGVAAFAQQLANSVLKIKEFCKDVKNAPTELQDILDQIEDFSLILSRLGSEEAQEASKAMNEDVLQASWLRCRKAVERVNALALELQGKMKRHKRRGAVKTVLDKSELKSLLKKLDRSKIDLHLAYTMFTDAQRKEEISTIRRYMEDERKDRVQYVQYFRAMTAQRPEEEKTTERGAAPQHSVIKRSRKASEDTVRKRIRLPFWLCQYAWDIAFEHASGSWTVSLKTFKVLPRGHDVWDMCILGDIKGIRHLLETRQLSIHDQNQDGNTLFMFASSGSQTEFTRFLLERGAQPLGSTIRWRSLLNEPYFIRGWGAESMEQVQMHAQLLISVSDDVDDRYLEELERLAKPQSAWTPFDVLAALEQFSGDIWYRLLCSVDLHDPELLHTKTSSGNTLLHVLACNWGHVCTKMDVELADTLTQTLRLATEASVDLHVRNANGDTPFMLLLLQLYGMHCEMRCWLELLWDTGIDLSQYGEVESERIKSSAPEDRCLMRTCYLLYGPQPSDWAIVTGHPGDVFAGTFWDMLEHPERAIPGAWNLDQEDVSWYDDSRRGRWGRGVKAKMLRRVKSEMKSGSRSQIDALFDGDDFHKLRKLMADDWRARNPYPPTREYEEYFGSIRTLSWSLGIPPGSVAEEQDTEMYSRLQEVRANWESISQRLGL